jgi:phosphoserine aminotransferase
MSKIHNFSAGPAILPQSAIDASIEALKNFSGTGLSLIEVSHRSKEYEAVVAEATQLVKDILKLGDDYEVVYLQGGASFQFDMLPYNFLGDGQTAAYTNTGVWASRAVKEAKFFGNVNVVASAKTKISTISPKILPFLQMLHISTAHPTIPFTEPKCSTSLIPMACH